MMRRNNIAIVTLGATMFGAIAAIAQVPPTTPTPAANLPTLPTAPADAPVAPAAPGAPLLPPADPGATAPMPGTTAPDGTTAAPGLPGTTPQFPGSLPGGLPAFPGATPASPFGMQTGTASAVVAIPTPPPLGTVNLEAADSTTADTTATVSGASAPSQLYTFLFIDEPDYGIVRQRFNADVAETLKEQEIQRLMTVRRTGQQPGGGITIPGVTPGYDPTLGGAGFQDPALGGGFGADPYAAGGGFGPGLGAGQFGAGATPGNESAIRAAAEWDFYYDQLEMYDTYVREKLIPNSENLPVLEYDAANALQERQDLFESFQEEAIEQSNMEFNANKEFYERLQHREDRRRDYMEWLLIKERQVADWAEVWARRVFGTRWADGEEVRVDDWYYGTDFNSANPVLVAIDDREYIISRQPVANLQDGQLNVISNNLTPYDIIDNNGYLKNPVMETLRGTLVIPPAGPVYTTSPTTGTIEIVGSVTTE